METPELGSKREVKKLTRRGNRTSFLGILYFESYIPLYHNSAIICLRMASFLLECPAIK